MCNHAMWFKVKQSKQLLQYDFLKQEFINNSNIKSDKFNFRECLVDLKDQLKEKLLIIKKYLQDFIRIKRIG